MFCVVSDWWNLEFIGDIRNVWDWAVIWGSLLLADYEAAWFCCNSGYDSKRCCVRFYQETVKTIGTRTRDPCFTRSQHYPCLWGSQLDIYHGLEFIVRRARLAKYSLRLSLWVTLRSRSHATAVATYATLHDNDCRRAFYFLFSYFWETLESKTAGSFSWRVCTFKGEKWRRLRFKDKP